jgi:N utilization substance protein A
MPAEAEIPAESPTSEVSVPAEQIAAFEAGEVKTVEEEEVVLPGVTEEVQPAVETGETQIASTEEEEEASFDKLFTLKPGIVEPVETEEEEEEEEGGKKTKKGKKKKRKSVEVEYDPDRDMMLIKKKHKRGDGEWDWEP